MIADSSYDGGGGAAALDRGIGIGARQRVACELAGTPADGAE
jgi:hypothetical protein